MTTVTNIFSFNSSTYPAIFRPVVSYFSTLDKIDNLNQLFVRNCIWKRYALHWFKKKANVYLIGNLSPCLKSILNLSKFWQKFDYMGLFLKLLEGKKNKKTQNPTTNFWIICVLVFFWKNSPRQSSEYKKISILYQLNFEQKLSFLRPIIFIEPG